MYGPTKATTASVLAHNGDGSPAWSWDCDLPPGALAILPACSFEMTLRDGKLATARFPSSKRTVLVDDPGRERVTQHWATVSAPSMFAWRRKAAMGCHLFAEERSDGLVVVEIVPSNGQVDPTKHHSHLGAVAYRTAEFKVNDSAWAMVGIGSFCPSGDWYMPSRAWTSLRLVLYRKSDATGKMRAERLLARLDLALPQVGSIVAADLIEYPRTTLPVQQALPYSSVNGTIPTNGMLDYDRDDAEKGKAQKGEPDAPAGFRVEAARAWQANEAAAKSAANDVPRLLSGNPLACFDMATGEPVWPERWPNRGEYHLTGQRIRFDTWVSPASGTLVTELGYAMGAQPREFNPGPCANKGLALNYTNPFDSAHLCRILSGLQSAWLLTRSWAAWLALRMIACDVMTSWTLYGKPWDQYWKAFSLQYALIAARNNPGHDGIGYLREQAWVADAVAGALVTATPGIERNRYLSWRSSFLELQAISNFESGINNAGTFAGNAYNLVPWKVDGLPEIYGTASTFQVALWAAGMHKLLASGPNVLPYSAKVTADICAAATTLYDNPALPLKGGSPPYYLGVTKNGVPENPIRVGTMNLAHSSVIHGWDHLARCAILTGNKAKWMDMIAPRLFYPPVSGKAAMRAGWVAKVDCYRALALKVSA